MDEKNSCDDCIFFRLPGRCKKRYTVYSSAAGYVRPYECVRDQAKEVKEEDEE